MIDRDMVSGVAFLLFLGGAVVIGILGASVLRRLGEVPAREPMEGERLITPGCILAGVLLAAIAFFSTFFPHLALLPIVLFSIRGLRAFGRGRPGRGAGAVFLLIGLSWLLLMVFQAAILLTGDSIRIDLFISLPVITLVSLLGEAIQASLSRSQLDS